MHKSIAGVSLLLALVLLVSCGLGQPAVASDQDLTKAVVGTWVEKQVSGEKNECVLIGTTTFKDDGTFFEALNGYVRGGADEEYTFGGTWSVKDGSLKQMYQASSLPKLHAIGSSTSVKIIKSTAKEIVYTAPDDSTNVMTKQE